MFMAKFDEIINRIHTNSVKWDSIATTYQEEDLIPLWVADMDFATLPEILASYQQLFDQKILGYTVQPPELFTAIINWQQKHHHLPLQKENILFFSGVLAGITTAIQAFTKKGDTIMIQDPVYPPFADIPRRNGRHVLRSPLLIENNHFVMDFADIEKHFQSGNVTLFILSNPHNPGGRVWTKAELLQLGKLCKQYGVFVLSDEIHQDLILPAYTMTTFFEVDPSFAEFAITFTSITKTFNLAGIKNSMAFVKDAALAKKLKQKQLENFQQEINTFGLIGTQVALEHGEPWLTELMDYLKENIDLVTRVFHEQLPAVQIMKTEGTYLMWLDFSAFGLTDKELHNTLVHDAKVVLNDGSGFGKSGTQHVRLNVATSRATLTEGLRRIVKTFAALPTLTQ
jgi:cystathionine beta-lyase